MKVSLNWLRDYVDMTLDVEELAHLLTMAGLEVEGVHATGEGFHSVVVAEIASIRRHPNADRLSLVDVRTDQQRLSVVCGASNIREGQRVPVALVGSRLPNGVVIKRSKIRGEVSEGMLCSEIELGLGQDAGGILILPEKVPLGMELGEALGMKDTVLDIAITPNRPDCLSILGIAREVAALTRQRVRYPQSTLSKEGQEIHRRTSVTIMDPDLCPRYVARMIDGITIGPSPDWMRNRLERVGIRSVNNVVDVTNYVMMEWGQPLHAFDFDVLEGGRIVVRRAEEGETFITLDGVTRTLDGQMLMICDGVKPVAIAGVMGGLNSEIRPETKRVLLESAYFDPAGNRRTSLRLGLETEAAYRFGRGIDYGRTLTAADRASELIRDVAGGKIVDGAVDAYPAPKAPKPIRLSPRRANEILGTDLEAELMMAHLRALELDVRADGADHFQVTPASFRGDLEREIDLIEEIARLDGYEKIPVTLPRGATETFSEAKDKEIRFEKEAIAVLTHHGFDEVITYSFTTPAALESIRLPEEDPIRHPIRILNPLSEDFSVLRTSLIPGLLEMARTNFARKNTDLKIFELKRVFLPCQGEKLPREKRVLAGFCVGFDRRPHWNLPARPVEFYDIKGCMEDLLEVFQIEGVRFDQEKNIPYLHPGKAAKMVLDNDVLGVLGEVHPLVAEHYELQGKTYLFEVEFEKMLQCAGNRKRFHPLPKFPAVFRDLSLIMDEARDSGDIVQSIRDLRQPFIDEIHLFDLYRGAPIPEGKKGLTYRIRYQSPDRTLTDEEVNQCQEKVISSLKEAFHVELR